ncbi:MAG TPA: purine-nucleoside phosphorylase [Alphaproteobacteria bacterium]|nr:purine-nucleoside phosphorylase [Alphaproteobacteria bacterium]
MTAAAQTAAAALKSRLNGFVPQVAVILGSGLGALADKVENPVVVPYGEIPDFPRTGVHGHAGQMVFGTIGGTRVVMLQGRVHFYEGDGERRVTTLVRTLKLIGAETLFLTCAAGSLQLDIGPGKLMLISDHINMLGTNPLVGANDESFGPRFPGLVDAWDPALRRELAKAASELDIALPAGTYAAVLGPSFETPAEVRMLKLLGADAVGMSTVPECIVARHAGMTVCGVAAITNLGVGLTDEEISHDQTLSAAAVAAVDLQRLIVRFLENLRG